MHSRSLLTAVLLALLSAACASAAPMQPVELRRGSLVVRLEVPARWQRTYSGGRQADADSFSLAAAGYGEPELELRLNAPARSNAADQLATHQALLATYRSAFTHPRMRTIARVPALGREVLIQQYDGISSRQFAAIVPLGASTFWAFLSDSRAGRLPAHRKAFIAMVRSLTLSEARQQPNPALERTPTGGSAGPESSVRPRQ